VGKDGPAVAPLADYACERAPLTGYGRTIAP
jgi:hypothetical protein